MPGQPEGAAFNLLKGATAKRRRKEDFRPPQKQPVTARQVLLRPMESIAESINQATLENALCPVLQSAGKILSESLRAWRYVLLEVAKSVPLPRNPGK